MDNNTLIMMLGVGLLVAIFVVSLVYNSLANANKTYVFYDAKSNSIFVLDLPKNNVFKNMDSKGVVNLGEL